MNKFLKIAIISLICGVQSACFSIAPQSATQTPIPSATQPPTATFTPSVTPTPVLPFAGKLAYASNQDGDYEIYVLTAQTGIPVQLTHNETDDRYPAISPDGGQIAYVSHVDGLYKLFIMDQDGENSTLAYEHSELHVYDPKWSPDGAQIIACIGNREIETKNCDIYAIDFGTGKATQITDLGYAICPEWSPDGEKLAFSSDFEGDPTVYISNSVGEETFAPEPGSGRWQLCPHWMPEGGKDLLALMGITDRVLVYTAYRAEVPSIMLATDAGRREVIPTHFYNLTEATSWTLDGRGIIVERLDNPSLTSTNIFIAQMHINLVLTEENLIQLTDTEGVDETDSTWGS